MTQLEKLVQEHAIYKAFFDGYLNRKMNEPEKPIVYPLDLIKQLGFEVVERLARLNHGIIYYDSTWPDADRHLFTTDINSLKNDS